MTLLDKVILEWSYKTTKGYPDINSQEDIALFESMFGINLNELKRLSFDILTPEAQEIATDLINILNIEKSQIQPDTKNHVVIYDDARTALVKRLEDNGKYGSPGGRSNNIFKAGKVTIIFKPDKTSGEYFDLKPQKLGLTVDKVISLSDSKQELVKGIDSNTKLSDEQKKVIKYLTTGQTKPTEVEIEKAFENKYFFNEFFKNLGEVLGAYNYGETIGADGVFFPKKGNYPLIDYILHKGEDQVQVSAKTSKGSGNTVKLEDLERLVKSRGGEIEPSLQKIINIINSNKVIEGAFALIDEFGSNTLKQQKEEYLKEYPNFPYIDKEGYDVIAHQKRIILEKQMIIELNQVYDFSDLFNQFVAVKYVKYDIRVPSLEEYSKVIEGGRFRTPLKSKDSKGHDSDKIGLDIKEIK